MQTNQPRFSINQIVILLVFLCAAIMTSLFVFHMRAQTRPMLSADLGTIFPEARELKPFDLVAGTGVSFTQQNLLNHWTLLFFGFTHCSSVCPTTLDLLKHVYPTLKKSNPSLQVVLVSLDPERDSPIALQKYTQSFHPEFIGVSGKLQDLRKLQSQMGVYAARDDQKAANYQLQHTANTFLITPQGKWLALFKFGLTPEAFKQAFNASVQSFVG